MSAMTFIAKTDVEESMIVSHSVAEDEYPNWTAGTYSAGDKRIYDHRVYESLENDNSDEPVPGGLTPWLDSGPTNSRRCFDDGDDIPTTSSEDFEVELAPGVFIGGVGLANVSGGEATVEAEDPDDGIVYSESKTLTQPLGPVGPHTFFFGRRLSVTEVVFLRIPANPNLTVRVTVTAANGAANVGECVIGPVHQVGDAQFGMEFGMRTLTRITENPFGTRIIKKGKTKRTRSFPVFIDSREVTLVDLVVRHLDGRPTFVIGSEDRAITLLYGLILRLRGALRNAVNSNYSIDVEQL